jgi:crotonobetainyl-CoA:carnitine CoA-transferase CaiB-like acyl-CoA transferase
MGEDQSVLPADLPLAGVRVLDLSWVLAGPLVGRLLADAGAEVIKVESHGRMDNTRLGRAMASSDGEIPKTDRVPLFHSLNAGKKSLDIDLRSPTAPAVVSRLTAVCDVVVENFAPGVLDRLGLGYDVLRAANERIILVSLSGTGQHGPLSDVPAYAPTVSSLAGLEGLVGYEYPDGVGHDGPVRGPVGMVGSNFADSLGGLYGFHAVLAALFARDVHGVGQHVDYSEMDGVCTMLAEPLIDYFLNERVMAPSGNTHRSGAPYGIFPAAGEDEWISIGVTSDEEWVAFCIATAGEDWVGLPEYSTAAGRRAAARQLHDDVAAYTARSPRDELVAKFRHHGVAASPVYRVGEGAYDDHFWARGLLARIDGVPGVGETTVYGSPWSLSATPVGPRGAGPSLGQHTREVLSSVVGMTEDEIDELVAAGVVS